LSRLLSGLKDPDWKVRELSASGIAVLDPIPDPIPHELLQSLGDTTWQVRLASFKAILTLSPDSAIAVGTVVEFTNEEQVELHRAADRFLRQHSFRDSSALETLAGSLTLIAPRSRSSAIGCLKRSPAVNSHALAKLRQAVHHLDPGDRKALLEVLSRSCPRSEALELLLLATRDADASVREFAVRELSELGRGDAQSLNRVVAMLGDPKVQVRAASARALGDLRATGRLSEVEGALSDSELEVRHAAVDSIASLGTAASSLAPKLIPLLGEDPPLASAVVRTLTKLDARVVREAVSPQLSSADTPVRVLDGMFRVLGHQGRQAREVVPTLVRLLATGRGDAALICDTIHAIGLNAQATLILLEQLGSESLEVQHRILCCVQLLRDECESFPRELSRIVLSSRESSGDSPIPLNIRVLALQTLQGTAYPKRGILLSAYMDPEPKLAVVAAEALSAAGQLPPDGLPRLLDLVAAGNPRLRARAAVLAISYGEPAVLPIAKALETGDWTRPIGVNLRECDDSSEDSSDMRCQIVQSLGELGQIAASAAPVLRRLARAPDKSLKKAAAHALSSIESE